MSEDDLMGVNIGCRKQANVQVNLFVNWQRSQFVSHTNMAIDEAT